jgi:hypothetical protein
LAVAPEALDQRDRPQILGKGVVVARALGERRRRSCVACRGREIGQHPHQGDRHAPLGLGADVAGRLLLVDCGPIGSDRRAVVRHERVGATEPSQRLRAQPSRRRARSRSLEQVAGTRRIAGLEVVRRRSEHSPLRARSVRRRRQPHGVLAQLTGRRWRAAGACSSGCLRHGIGDVGVGTGCGESQMASPLLGVVDDGAQEAVDAAALARIRLRLDRGAEQRVGEANGFLRQFEHLCVERRPQACPHVLPERRLHGCHRRIGEARDEE